MMYLKCCLRLSFVAIDTSSEGCLTAICGVFLGFHIQERCIDGVVGFPFVLLIPNYSNNPINTRMH